MVVMLPYVSPYCRCLDRLLSSRNILTNYYMSVYLILQCVVSSVGWLLIRIEDKHLKVIAIAAFVSCVVSDG